MSGDEERERVDLSALDPERDPERWRRVVASTRHRVTAVLRERERALDPIEILGGWARPVLAAAAALALLLGATEAALRLERGEVTDARRLARLSEQSVLSGRSPTGAELRSVLRGEAAP